MNVSEYLRLAYEYVKDFEDYPKNIVDPSADNQITINLELSNYIDVGVIEISFEDS